MQQLQSQWESIAADEPGLQQRYSQLCHQLDTRRQWARDQQRKQQFLHRVQALEQTHGHPPEHWPRHWQRAWRCGRDATVDTAPLQRQYLLLDIFSGQPSPKQEQALRMDVQVELVQHRLNGELPETDHPPEWILLAWLEAGGGSLPGGHPLAVRFRLAMQRWLDA